LECGLLLLPFLGILLFSCRSCSTWVARPIFDFEELRVFRINSCFFFAKVNQFDAGNQTVAVGKLCSFLLALRGGDRLHLLFDQLDL